jgi:hypothetical protein
MNSRSLSDHGRTTATLAAVTSAPSSKTFATTTRE